MHPIQFHTQDISFNLPHKTKLRKWIENVVQSNGNRTLKGIQYVFCSDAFLLTLNKDYLHHDTFTDIITFDNSDHVNEIEADIFISIERIRENAVKWQVPVDQELNRVMIHGVLHLLGFNDKTKEDKVLMREKENECLNLLVD